MQSEKLVQVANKHVASRVESEWRLLVFQVGVGGQPNLAKVSDCNLCGVIGNLSVALSR